MQESHFCVMLGSLPFSLRLSERIRSTAHQEGFCCNCICCCFSWKRKDTRLWHSEMITASGNRFWRKNPSMENLWGRSWLKDMNFCTCSLGPLDVVEKKQATCEAEKAAMHWAAQHIEWHIVPRSLPKPTILESSTELLEITGGEWLQVQECKEWTHAQLHK